jgi:long-chain fatty acid transport protein
MTTLSRVRTAVLGTAVGIGLGMLASAAFAGGFAIREQSASSQGASFAGNAANTDLSAMYWNPAGAANKTGGGIHTESHYSIIFPRAKVTVDGVDPPGFPGGLLPPGAVFPGSPTSSDIADPAIVPASYATMQIAPNMFLGMSINSGFGLVTKPETLNYVGSIVGRTSKLFTTNATPTLAYTVMPGVTIGVGVQIQYADGKFKFASGGPAGPNSGFAGDDFAFGATAGIMLTPAPGTRIRLGWRSALTHELDGRLLLIGAVPPPVNIPAKVELNLPDIVTLSINQAITQNLRLLGTVEWSNWSRLQELRIQSAFPIPLALDARWTDGWFFSGGLEYDYSPTLTVRTGVAWERSPIDDPTKRLIGIPDSDRLWISAGASYKWSKDTTIDFAYTHIFLDDARFDRTTLLGPGGAPPPGVRVTGSVDASTDIVSASIKTKLCILGGC